MEIKIENIEYLEPNVSFENNDGTFIKKSLLNFNGMDNISFISPKLEIKSIDEKNIEILLPQIKSNREFFDFLNNLEKDSINKCSDNSLSWFKKQLSYQDINKLFKSHIQKQPFGEPYILSFNSELISKDVKIGDFFNFKIILDGILFAKHSFTLSLNISIDTETQEPVKEAVKEPVQEVQEPVKESVKEVVKEEVGLIQSVVNTIKEVIHGSEEIKSRFSIGEKIEINHFGTWYPCTVTNIINNDKYEVVYEDGTVQEVGYEYLKKIDDVIEILENQLKTEEVKEVKEEVKNEGPQVIVHDQKELKELKESILPVHPYELSQKNEKNEKTKEEIFIENIEKRIKEAALENDYDLVLKLHAVLKDLKK